MSDLISKSDAIDAINKCAIFWEEYGDDMSKEEIAQRIIKGVKNTIIEILRELPSVQPDHVADISKKVEGDCISRQAAIDAMKDALDPHIVQFVKSKMAIEALPSAQPEPHWIPCSEKMPSETVIATVETKVFRHKYVCEAVWVPRWTWKASFDEWEDCSEYKEEDDEYYVLEGWYERIHNWDEYAYVAIDDNVIAWTPMLIPYCGGNGE